MGEVQKWCVVTGGRGFAARHLVEMLIKYDMFTVRVADLGPAIELETSEEHGVLGEALRSGRAEYVSTDLRNKAQVLKAFDGAEVVFHMAAPNSSINSYKLHYSVNVEGTKNVIDACIEKNVKRLIYTSSPSVVFDGIHGIINGEESLPYPEKHIDSYSATKSEGEALIIKANGVNGLLTCSIRPSSIFGPGDRLLVPTLVATARAGKSKFIIGDGNNINDFTYVENVAHAHVCAERALASEGSVAEKASGQAYFITNMEPIKFWEFMSLLLDGLGYPRPYIKIPVFVMMPIAFMVEGIFKLLGPYGMAVPQLIPSRVRILSCSRSFNCSKAKDRLGYSPIISLQEGINKTIDSFSNLKAEHHPRKTGPSKASLYLGSGRVADTLLWKNKKLTLTVLLALVTIYYNIILPGVTLVTALSKILLLLSIFLFIHGNLPDKIFGYKIEKIPASHFHLSEEMARKVAASTASSWNNAVDIFMSLCMGNDFVLFIKVIIFLLVVSFTPAVSLQTLFLIVLLIAFGGFFVYEKKEQEIDALFLEILSFGCKVKSDAVRKLCISKKVD